MNKMIEIILFEILGKRELVDKENER